MCRDVDPDKISAVWPNDDDGIEQFEANRWDNKQVHGGNPKAFPDRKHRKEQPARDT
jgi:hypothetical protein